jgi:hypothetical protein
MAARRAAAACHVGSFERGCSGSVSIAACAGPRPSGKRLRLQA